MLTAAEALLLLLLWRTSRAQEKKDNEWRWLPESQHPCSIQRMSLENVFENFGSGGIPAYYSDPLVIVSNGRKNEKIRRRTARENIVKAFSTGFNVTLSSSNSFSEHRRTISLETYLEEIAFNDSATHPGKNSSELWYLFGETYTSEWKDFLRAYQLPPCQVCQDKYVALSFGIGNRGSGVQWHTHGPGFSEALHGRKHWVLYPPHHPPPHYHPDESSRNWMEYVYTNTSKLLKVEKRSNIEAWRKGDEHLVAHGGRPYECTLHPGDLIYFPDRWHHATINCDPYTAFISTFTSDHLYLQDQKWNPRHTESNAFSFEL